MGLAKTVAAGTLIVVGVTAAQGGPEARENARDAAKFVAGTSWSAVSISAGALADVAGEVLSDKDEADSVSPASGTG